MTGFFSGTATAMITPFRRDGGVCLDAFGKMIEHDDSVEIDEDIKIRLPGDVYTALGYSSYVTGDSSGRTSSAAKTFVLVISLSPSIFMVNIFYHI